MKEERVSVCVCLSEYVSVCLSACLNACEPNQAAMPKRHIRQARKTGSKKPGESRKPVRAEGVCCCSPGGWHAKQHWRHARRGTVSSLILLVLCTEGLGESRHEVQGGVPPQPRVCSDDDGLGRLSGVWSWSCADPGLFFFLFFSSSRLRKGRPMYAWRRLFRAAQGMDDKDNESNKGSVVDEVDSLVRGRVLA
ncbi:hypothetical protein MN608_00455 [Microdochium nivale]|nr:hypothetical protein MN608_00455 [Microdochium nivale]